VDAFASSVVNSVLGKPDEIKPGNPLYGLYGTLAHLIPNSSLEPYFFWRLAPTGYGAAYADGAKGHLNEKTFGVRWSGKLPSHFDYDVEMAVSTVTLARMRFPRGLAIGAPGEHSM